MAETNGRDRRSDGSLACTPIACDASPAHGTPMPECFSDCAVSGFSLRCARPALPRSAERSRSHDRRATNEVFRASRQLCAAEPRTRRTLSFKLRTRLRRTKLGKPAPHGRTASPLECDVVEEGFIRLSVGCEDARDLIADFERAL